MALCDYTKRPRHIVYPVANQLYVGITGGMKYVGRILDIESGGRRSRPMVG